MGVTAIKPPDAVPAGPPAGVERPDFQVVPRIGLVFAGIAAVALIVAIAANKLWPLAFLHVGGGAAWTIIDLFVGLIIGPIIGRTSIPARIEFTTRFMPKMVVIMPIVVTLTLGAGWQLASNLGTISTGSSAHPWLVASFTVVV